MFKVKVMAMDKCGCELCVALPFVEFSLNLFYFIFIEKEMNVTLIKFNNIIGVLSILSTTKRKSRSKLGFANTLIRLGFYFLLISNVMANRQTTQIRSKSLQTPMDD